MAMTASEYAVMISKEYERKEYEKDFDNHVITAKKDWRNNREIMLSREQNWCKQRHIYVNDSINTFSREREDIWREFYASIRESGRSYDLGKRWCEGPVDCSWKYDNESLVERLGKVMREISGRVETA